MSVNAALHIYGVINKNSAIISMSESYDNCEQ